MNKYWWGGGDDVHKIHWMGWKKLALPKKYGGLGFRALHEFNIAMLAKQGWRMLANTDSLATKMLKARYFPCSDFLNSELKPTSSLIWRSIWSSKELLKQGCRRLIGDGRSTLIWDDPWLPGGTQGLIQSLRPEGFELMYVSDLIDENTCTWRRDMVMENFNLHEAQLIMSIPLSWMRRNDGWTWLFTQDGNYSIRSGYHQAIRMRRPPTDPSSSSTSFRGSRLWSLNIPEKIRLLVWSAYRDILPTMENLRQKRIAMDLECPMCHVDTETAAHCFMTCPVARAVWLGSPLTLRVSELPVDNFADFFDALLVILDSKKLSLFWRGAASVQRRSETQWRPPDAGVVKINVDGAISAQQKIYGSGAVARDSSGEVVSAMMSKEQGLVSTEVSEACSLRQALKWAKDLMLDKVVVETDCASIVTAINCDTYCFNSSLRHILMDCKNLMASFTICRLQHVGRNGNSVAHELARRALQAEDDLIWFGETPKFIAHLCNGIRHADQQLKQSGELLTHVWLMMAQYGITDTFRSHQATPRLSSP
ncbi:hypothetical protein SLEP1_g44951 [Rubroshorea leprosula]|uniref:RNase H type-1 domain-containing protein n=1 Tax=Rubroshorea leprosula TaxID=152421 RepID=A0AAV5LHX2_9ROSI|nr:hypothetical protein SLEP1_g44951 [Rubroshorea leprosula]